MKQRIRALAYVLSGHFFVLAGIIGVFLPVLPTTPFILVAAFCYERGSPRFHVLLIENRFVGPHINNWRQHRSIPLRGKIIAVSTITLSICYVVFTAPLLLAKFAMAIIGLSVSLYIITRPTAKPAMELCVGED